MTKTRKKNSDGNRLENYVGLLSDQWIQLHARYPQILYHYTDGQGLLGMLKTQRLWASNIRFMNDPTEIEYATRLVRAVAEERRPNYPDEVVEVVRGGITDIADMYENIPEDYITCFCEKGDLLSQWRGYGAVGGGYALGFAAEHLGLHSAWPGGKLQPLLRKVIYSPKEQKLLIRKWVELLLDWEMVRRRDSDRSNETINPVDVAWGNFNWFLSECLRCFKDPAYKEEQEWRVIRFGSSSSSDEKTVSDFRASRGRIIQFVELDLTESDKEYKGKLPLRVIRYGPTLDPRTAERSLRLLCNEKGYGKLTDIKRSGVPFSG